MTVNRIATLTILFSIISSAGSSHAMFLQRAMQRSGTKYATQLAQNTQRRWLETESKITTSSSGDTQKTIASLSKRIDLLEKQSLTADSLVKGVVIYGAAVITVSVGVVIICEKFEPYEKLEKLWTK